MSTVETVVRSHPRSSVYERDEVRHGAARRAAGLLPDLPPNIPVNNFSSVIVADNQTRNSLPARGWNVILRLYGPLDPWFDKTWRPSEIELCD